MRALSMDFKDNRVERSPAASHFLKVLLSEAEHRPSSIERASLGKFPGKA